jgi:[ribosomal protein S5]-alanine N-acetyltransferase
MTHPGWPATLTEGPVTVRPYARGDAAMWSRVRRENEAWLAQWEPLPPGSWHELNSPAAFRAVYKDLNRAAKAGTAMPFAIWYNPPGERERLVGQLTLGNIVRRAFCNAYVGYWIDGRVAGRGIMPTALALVVDHAFRRGGIHRLEVNIRPENMASRRVVEKLGFREEAYHPRYLHIDGGWRDHIGYAMTSEDVFVDGGLVARWRRLRTAATPSGASPASPRPARDEL